MKNINIPEPCSENWNEMTPTEKGGFCKKCALDVYDFTNKSGDEIRDILALNIGSRVCGRIEPKQLNALNEDFSSWRMTNKRSYQRAWVFTLFVVFGMTLFSCEEDEIPAIKKLQETTQTILSNTPEPDVFELGELVESDEDMTTGQVQYVPEPAEIEVPEEIDLLGEFDIVGTMEYYPEEAPKEDVALPETDLKCFKKGVMISTTRYTEYLVDSTQISCEENELSGLIYPNPATNQTTLRVNMPLKGKAEIELYTLNGQKIKTVHSGRIRKGESEYPIDLTSLDSGTYFVIIYNNGNKETVKFTKI